MAQTVGSAFQAAYRDIIAVARARLAREQAPMSAGTLVHEV